MSDRKTADLDGKGGGKELGGENIVKIYYVGKKFGFDKRKK